MTTRILRFLAIVATGFLALRAFAHEVDCEKTVGVIQVDANGNPVLGPDLLPIFVTTPSTTLAIETYPAVIGWRVRVNNLAAEPSYIELLDDPSLASADTQIHGWMPMPGVGGPRWIPAGQSTEAVIVQRIRSYEECVGEPPPQSISALSTNGSPPDGEMCHGRGRVNVLTVVTESNIAVCRAKLKCKPPPQEDRLPPTCQRVNGIVWCYNPELCGIGCEAVCDSLDRTTSISDADWLAAQDTQAECDAISTAFGVPTPSTVAGFTFGCIEDGFGDHSTGALIGPLMCSTAPSCPAAHRLAADNPGQECTSTNSRLSLCPCQARSTTSLR